MATSDKYDRQLRLWGASGQRALSETCVVLVRATACGTETLKNLVLPGIGSILVVDDAPPTGEVTPHDASTNFFTPTAGAATTKSRAETACHHLLELNPDVQGDFVTTTSNLFQCVSSPRAWEDTLRGKTFGKERILVVASDLEPPLREALGNTCEVLGQCLIVVQSYGLLGVVRLQTPALPVMDPKPRDSPPDLRLTCPFAALSQMAQTIDWSNLDSKAHKHVPYPLILLHVAQEYKDKHEGKLPQTYSEKQEFQSLIKQMAQDYNEEENFQQAVQNMYLAYAGRTLDVDHLTDLLDQAKRHKQQNNRLEQFAILLQALLEFASQHDGNAPLQGTIPDMTASTEQYVQLQTIYKQQAAIELEEMKQLIAAAIAAIPDCTTAKITVDDETLRTFCQNAHHLHLVTCRSLQEEYHGTMVPEEIIDDLLMALQDEGEEKQEMLPLLWYLGLQACDAFYRSRGRYPGTNEEDDYLADVEPLQQLMEGIIGQRYRLQDASAAVNFYKAPNPATELCRFGNAEVHTIAALVGGVASQEAVKLITGQYTPIQHVYVYNGIASTGGVYKV